MKSSMTGSKLLSLLAVICLCFTLCSCGKKDKNETDNTSAPQSSAVGGNSTEADNDLTVGASEGSSQQTAGSSDKSGSSADQGSSANKGNSSSGTTGSGSSVNFGGQDDGVIDYDDSGSSSDKNTGNGSSQGGSSSGSSSDSGSSSNSSLDFNNPSNWDIREFD